MAVGFAFSVNLNMCTIMQMKSHDCIEYDILKLFFVNVGQASIKLSDKVIIRNHAAVFDVIIEVIRSPTLPVDVNAQISLSSELICFV